MTERAFSSARRSGVKGGATPLNTPSGDSAKYAKSLERVTRLELVTSSLGRSLATPQPLGNPVFSGGYVGAVYPGMSRSATQSGVAGGVAMWDRDGSENTADGRESGE